MRPGHLKKSQLYAEVLERAPHLFRDEEHVAAFALFARRLDECAERAPEIFSERSAERRARQVLRELWRGFRRDIRDPRRRSERLNALSKMTDDEIEADRQRRMEQSLRERLRSIDEPFDVEFAHIAYVGALCNDVYPMLVKQIAGYVAQMIGGHPNLPVTGDMVRAHIISWLDAAPELAGKIAALEMNRERVMHP